MAGVGVLQHQRVRVIVISITVLIIGFIVLLQALDMVRQNKIEAELSSVLTSRLVTQDLQAEVRVKSTVGDYYIPDVTNDKVVSNVMNELYPQVLTQVNAFNIKRATPFFIYPITVMSYNPNVVSTDRSIPPLSADRSTPPLDPQLSVGIEVQYAGLLGTVKHMQITRTFPLHHYRTATAGGA